VRIQAADVTTLVLLHQLLSSAGEPVDDTVLTMPYWFELDTLPEAAGCGDPRTTAEGGSRSSYFRDVDC
jgi:hypothetical protein